MTPPREDLTAVCERHGIETVPYEGHGMLDKHMHWYARNPRGMFAKFGAEGVTEQDAVLNVLRLMYEISTGMAPTISDGCMFMAVSHRTGEPVDEYSYESEFEAVVRVADRLREVGG